MTGIRASWRTLRRPAAGAARGPVVHKHRFVSVSSVSGASAGGAADGTAGDAGITKTEVPAHGDEPLGFRVWKGQAVSHFYACI